MDGQEGKDICHRNEEDDIFPELREPMEPERTKWKKNPKSRKSLAWNSAFFTDAGMHLFFFWGFGIIFVLP